jgi:hypothetical protein
VQEVVANARVVKIESARIHCMKNFMVEASSETVSLMFKVVTNES